MQLGGHEQREHGDAQIGRDADDDQLFRRVLSRQPSEEDGEGESHDLRDQKGDEKPGGIKAQGRSVGGGHVDDGIDAVNVEEEGKKKQEGLLFFFYAPEGFRQPVKASGDGGLSAGLGVMLLPIPP